MSVETIHEAAKNGDVESMVKFARIYLEGCGVEKDIDRAIKWFKKAADAGNAEAKTYLAYFYLRGIGVESDEIEALDLYRQAAEANDDVACYTLGLIYKKGLYGKKQNFDKAKDLFEKSASKDNYAAIYEMALIEDKEAAQMALSTDSITQSKAVLLSNKVEEELKKAAECGHIPAKYALGVKYIKSSDSKKQSLALSFFNDCCDKNIAAAYYAIAYMYDLGIGIERDYWKSYEYYKKAYDLGFKRAVLNIIYALMTGLGVKKNYKKAIDLCRDAVNDGMKEANYYAGLCFRFGFGVDKDIDKAEELFGYAAEVEFAPAIYQLGVLNDPYYGGEDDDAAFDYYTQASSLGNVNSLAELGRIKLEENKQEALELLKKAAELNSYVAYEILGDIYDKGADVKQDLIKAYEYNKKAADLGSVSSIKYVINVANEKKDQKILTEYTDKLNVRNDSEEYYEMAKQCREAGDVERAAFWLAMAAEYSEEEGLKDKAFHMLNKYEKTENGIWSLKKEN